MGGSDREPDKGFYGSQGFRERLYLAMELICRFNDGRREAKGGAIRTKRNKKGGEQWQWSFPETLKEEGTSSRFKLARSTAS